MPLGVKLWKVDADRPKPVEPSRLGLEGRLEEWLCKDIRLLSDDLLVIGQQIEQYGTFLDLLAVDRDGNLVIVELKRDRTPRDVVAQALDYASWVQELGREDIERYAAKHLGKSFDDAFEEAFGQEPPEVVNEPPIPQPQNCARSIRVPLSEQSEPTTVESPALGTR